MVLQGVYRNDLGEYFGFYSRAWGSRIKGLWSYKAVQSLLTPEAPDRIP